MITRKLTTFAAQGAALTAVAVAAFSPMAANADSWNYNHNHNNYNQGLQNDKNTNRNVALGSAALAIYGLVNHNGTATALGTLGAVIAGGQYENDRQVQSDGYRDYRGDRGYYRHDRGSYDYNNRSDCNR